MLFPFRWTMQHAAAPNGFAELSSLTLDARGRQSHFIGPKLYQFQAIDGAAQEGIDEVKRTMFGLLLIGSCKSVCGSQGFAMPASTSGANKDENAIFALFAPVKTRADFEHDVHCAVRIAAALYITPCTDTDASVILSRIGVNRRRPPCERLRI